MEAKILTHSLSSSFHTKDLTLTSHWILSKILNLAQTSYRYLTISFPEGYGAVQFGFWQKENEYSTAGLNRYHNKSELNVRRRKLHVGFHLCSTTSGMTTHGCQREQYLCSDIAFHLILFIKLKDVSIGINDIIDPSWTRLSSIPHSRTIPQKRKGKRQSTYISQAIPGYRLANQVPPSWLLRSNIRNWSKPNTCWSRAPIHIPDSPAPITTTG